MILTCPQCTTRYLLPAVVLAPDGHNVKCSNCEEVWFQIPDPEELAELQASDVYEVDAPPAESFEDFVDIPEGVRPDVELDQVHTDEDDTSAAIAASGLKGMIGGYAAAACVFFAVLGVLVAAKTTMVGAWPPSAALYQMLGMSIDAPGEGLVFDRIQAESQGMGERGEELMIAGKIINLTNKDQNLPVIEASLRSPTGTILESLYIEVPENKVPAESEIQFMQNYESTHEGAYDVSVRFALNAKKASKTVSEDGDNTHAQSADDPAPPHDDAASQESRAPASAPHH